MQTASTIESVKEYYGRILKNSVDLKTNACCSTDALPVHIKSILKQIDDEVISRFYGCGSPLPDALSGCTVLDLGCGSGRDVFIASKLVGAKGSVIGIDMTDEQLEVANRHVKSHMDRFGYDCANVSFRKGYIEDLATAGIADNTVDVVISNCVINLSPDKRAVFKEILRVLKPGGELYFSDVFADRRVPEDIARDPVLYGECLGGSMYFEDFRRLLVDLGLNDFRVVSSSQILLENDELERKVGNICFTSKTVRVFNLPDQLEDQCENYGQVAYYNGTLDECPHRFVLDDHHVFERAMPVPVCGNTAAMIQESRFAAHFTVTGNRNEHFGLFDCSGGTDDPQDCGC